MLVCDSAFEGRYVAYPVRVRRGPRTDSHTPTRVDMDPDGSYIDDDGEMQDLNYRVVQVSAGQHVSIMVTIHNDVLACGLMAPPGTPPTSPAFKVHTLPTWVKSTWGYMRCSNAWSEDGDEAQPPAGATPRLTDVAEVRAGAMRLAKLHSYFCNDTGPTTGPTTPAETAKAHSNSNKN